MRNFTHIAIILSTVIFVSGVSYLMLRESENKDIRIKWMKPSQEAFYEAKNIFGIPDVIVPTSFNEKAMWNNNSIALAGYSLSKLIVKNEIVNHCCPTPHIDCVYGTVNVDIKDSEKMLAILGTSTSFMYDQGKNQLTVRCCCLGTILAHLVFATNILLRSKSEVISGYVQKSVGNTLLQEFTDLFNSVYSPWKNNDNKTYESVRNQLREKLIENLAKLTHTTIQSCDGPSCANVFDYVNVNKSIGGTEICYPGPQTVALPQTEGLIGYYGGSIPSNGKTMTLGYKGLPNNQ